MDPDIWGKPAWLFLHSIAYNYPIKPTYDDKMNYGNFFNNLQFVLPCNICSQHCKETFQYKSVFNNNVLESRENLINWLIDVHNDVNKRLNKPSGNYNDMMKLITNKLDTTDKSVNYYKYISIILGIGSLIFLFFFLRNNKKYKWFIH